LAGVFCTMTRSAWLGAGVALLVIAGLALPRRLRLPAVATCVLLAGLVGATQWERLMTFKRDRELSAAETADSVRLRPILAMIAWQMFEDRPLTGCGLGHYDEAHHQYVHERPLGLPLDRGAPYAQHNVLLAYLTETGLIGVALFALLLGLWLRDALRLWRNCEAPVWMRRQALLFLAFFASYFVNGMFHDVALIPMINMLLYYFAGVTVALRQQGEAFATETVCAVSGEKLAESLPLSPAVAS